ncbi:MAG: lipid A deacylase LpxR family protein [Planctomycetales bacterium]|nr:lipid A deacylase LpxR family protein [Planctomycetales bacterium]
MKKFESVKKTRSTTQSFFVCLLFLFPIRYAHAADAVSLYLENDSKRMKPNHATDRHYTNGTKLVYLTQPDWQWLEDFSVWNFDTLDQPVDTAVGFFFGQNIYTPDHADEPAERSPDDMVFAGWLYTGLFAERAADDILDHIELNVGVIGPSSRAEQTQQCIHDLFSSGEPIGWDTQLDDEFAVDVSYLRQQRITEGVLAPTEKTDFITEYGFTAGSVHRHAQAGVTFRYGFNLGRTFGPGHMSQPDGISVLRRDFEKSGYLFIRGAARAVEYNRFLTGLDTEPLVGEFQAGIVFRHKKLDIGYAQTFFTREFAEQSGKDSIGAITLSWQF